MTPPETSETSDNREPGNTSDTRSTSVIVNAIAVLRSFTAEEPLLGVTEIAGRIGLHKSTVSRILATFEQEHLVERDDDSRRFRLGLGMIALAGPLLAELEERRVAYPVLRELTERTGETSALMVWNGGESMCVEQIASRHQVKHLAPLGARYNEALSSSVQVFLAAEDADRVRRLLNSGSVTLPGLDEEAVEGYLLRLKDSAERGWFANFGETSIDEVGVASPVFDHRGDVVASVLIAAPKFRVSQDSLTSLGEACLEASRKITTRLGGRSQR
ncbi:MULTISPECIES: IclR family transcriptional regulator [Arthrobacter]|uniref:IclR family transcriptional regulator n=1 Tax=Arthrobacter terricola TaxID=2547396 RepID=A0A4R5K6G6_9MICC|nr:MULTISPECIES: IclR family transcriptional regulator [Arthrobacter]MBT8163548.1 IclR family transcriptional regulator [Arthrobacter sp. GN70]TDF88851.1 IclR family transcriptional regulator [Arthrobacter terricola]